MADEFYDLLSACWVSWGEGQLAQAECFHECMGDLLLDCDKISREAKTIRNALFKLYFSPEVEVLGYVVNIEVEDDHSVVNEDIVVHFEEGVGLALMETEKADDVEDVVVLKEEGLVETETADDVEDVVPVEEGVGLALVETEKADNVKDDVVLEEEGEG